MAPPVPPLARFEYVSTRTWTECVPYVSLLLQVYAPYAQIEHCDNDTLDELLRRCFQVIFVLEASTQKDGL